MQIGVFETGHILWRPSIAIHKSDEEGDVSEIALRMILIHLAGIACRSWSPGRHLYKPILCPKDLESSRNLGI